MSSNLYLFNYFLALGFLDFLHCEISLYVSQQTKDFDGPVVFAVQNTIGSNFSLTCELINSDLLNETYIDDHLTWFKQDPNVFKDVEELKHFAKEKSKELYDHLQKGEINKAVLHFESFSEEDAGVYVCVSVKYSLYRVVEVKEDNFGKAIKELISPDYIRKFYDSHPKEVRFCNDRMFKCLTSTPCIPYHYVCDGRNDCGDGSDESWAQCGEDPCAGKLSCNDGRCIPPEWCCDNRFDANCTVRNRPSCCPPLVDPAVYHEEQIRKNVIVKGNSTRYLFITICIVSTFLSVLLFILILSKVCNFTSKHSYNSTARSNMFSLSRRRPIVLGGTVITRYSRSPARDCQHLDCVIRQEFLRSYSCSYRPNVPDGRSSSSLDRQSEVYDPLLGGTIIHSTENDQPPSYAEAVKVSGLLGFGRADTGFRASSTPPPPYSSTETLQGGCSDEGNRSGRPA